MKLLVLALSTLPVQLLAQADTAAALRTPPPTYTSNLGIGLGIDHGGIGLQLQYRPVPPLAFFVGGGYALAGLGYNLGMQVRLLPKKKWCPYVAGMYGYHAAIRVRDRPEYDQLYFGPSASIGVEDHNRFDYGRFWSFGLILPFRPQQFTDDLDALKLKPDIQIYSEPPDILGSVSLHFGL